MKNYLESGDTKCLTCHTELEELDCTDIETSFNYVRLLKVGSCPDCGKFYQWYEEFAYEGHTIPEEIDQQN